MVTIAIASENPGLALEPRVESVGEFDAKQWLKCVRRFGHNWSGIQYFSGTSERGGLWKVCRHCHRRKLVAQVCG